MKAHKKLPKTIKIGDCELDVPSGVVVDGDRSTRLDPKSVDVAIYLAEHADQLVTHDQLLEAVWPNKFVTDSQFSKRITEIRQALGDTQKPYRYIETLPKRGYRLVCKPEIVEEGAEHYEATGLPSHPTRGFASARPLLDMATGVFVITLGYFAHSNWFAQDTVLHKHQVAMGILSEEIKNDRPFSEFEEKPGISDRVEATVRRNSDRVRITAQLFLLEHQLVRAQRWYSVEVRDL